jgi:hypothetical protein
VKFDTAKECVIDLERRITYRSWSESQDDARKRERRGQKQTQCAACLRWKWPSEGCNLFSPKPPSEGEQHGR